MNSTVATLVLLLSRAASAAQPGSDGPAAAAAEGQVAPPPSNLPVNPVIQVAPPAPEPWTRHLTVGGGAILYYYQPFLDGAKDNVDLFFANIVLDARLGRFGFHAEPRIRNGKLRPFFAGPAWVQEVYGHGSVRNDDGEVVVKIGKVYSHLGLFWDNSFYGNVQVYDGLKLDPDYGISVEGAYGDKGALGVHAWAQFFLVDGQTNVSLAGRDTIGVADAQGGYPFRRRNQIIGRVEPFLRLGADTTIKLGLSAERLQADLPAEIGTKNVFRGAADLTLSGAGFNVWAEYLRQNGQTVSAFPIAGAPASATGAATPGQGATRINYALAGGEYTHGLFTARYVFSLGDYHDLSIKETMHVPSLGLTLDPGLALLAELVIWQRHAGGVDTFVDRSLNVTLHGHF
jgi:hypothetical protein